MPGVQDERQTALTVNMSKADSQYVDDALTIEDEYESELAAVQVELTRFEVSPARVRRPPGRDRGPRLLQAGRGAPALPRPEQLARRGLAPGRARHAGSALYGNLRIPLDGGIESDRGPRTEPLRARRRAAAAGARRARPGDRPVRGRARASGQGQAGALHGAHRAARRRQDRTAQHVPVDGTAAPVGNRQARGPARPVHPPPGRERAAHGGPGTRAEAPGAGPHRRLPRRAQGVRAPRPQGAQGLHGQRPVRHRRARRPRPGRLRRPRGRPDRAVHRRRLGRGRPGRRHRPVRRRDAGRPGPGRVRAVRRLP